MSDPSGSPRASRAIKLVLMGVAGAALLYSCAPGAGLGGLPYIWFLPNPFFRGPAATPTPGVAPSQASPSPSQRGGFGATGEAAGSSGTT